MTFTQNVNPTLVKQPRLWSCAISLSDGTNWKLCCSPGATGAGANGDKLVSALATSSDTTPRVLQMGFGRQTTVTATNATPAVFTQTGSIIPLGVCDQMILGGTAVPTGFTAGTTYYVSVTGLNNVTGVYSLSTTPANAAAGTNIASTSTGTAVTATIVRTVGAVSLAATAGTDGTTAAVNFFNNTLVPMCLDQDAQSYQFLENGDFLYFATTGTITSAKFINVTAISGDF